MSRLLIAAISFLIIVACSTRKASIDNRFIVFHNNKNLSIRRDSEVIEDKKFMLELPNNFKEYTVSVNTIFTHVFTFSKDQKVIIIYKPEDENKGDQLFANLSISKFQDIANKFRFLENIKIKPLNGRRFGVRVLGRQGLYVLYFNVKSEQIKAFDYSLESLKVN